MTRREFCERILVTIEKSYDDALVALGSWELTEENLMQCREWLTECKDEDLQLVRRLGEGEISAEELITRKLAIMFKMKTVVDTCHGVNYGHLIN